jgi:hypothetical protein
MTNKILYKAIPANKTCHGHKWTYRKWHKIEGELAMPTNGFHACTNFMDAMPYMGSEGYTVIVEVRGKSIIDCAFLKMHNKECWSEMRIIKWHKWEARDWIALMNHIGFTGLCTQDDIYERHPRTTDIGIIRAAESAMHAANIAAKSIKNLSNNPRKHNVGFDFSDIIHALRAATHTNIGAMAKITQECHDFIVNRKWGNIPLKGVRK